MNRITIKDLRIAANRLNVETNGPLEQSTRIDGRYSANVGNYHISQAYGGYSLHLMSNTSGGVHDVFHCGHVPARDLYNRIQGMFAGLGAKS